MLKDITLGQYFPGNSLIHRADARFKLIYMVLFMVFVFAAKSDISLLTVIIATFLIVLISKVSAKIILKGLKPLIFILAFTAIINIFWISGETLVLSLGPVKIYKEGILTAIFMVVRLLCLIAGTSVLLSYTTSPVALTDAVERLFSPLKKIKVPVHEFAMMMTIALRFIPTLVEETDKIISAQKARGADFESGGLIKRIKAMIPILIPLFVSAFRRADELAMAMECRCYQGGEGRTRLKQMKVSGMDIILLFIFIILTVSVFILNAYKIIFII